MKTKDTHPLYYRDLMVSECGYTKKEANTFVSLEILIEELLDDWGCSCGSAVRTDELTKEIIVLIEEKYR